MRLKSGRTWLTMNTSSWRLTHATGRGGFAWRWPLAIAVGAALLALTLVALSRRRPSEAVPAAL